MNNKLKEVVAILSAMQKRQQEEEQLELAIDTIQAVIDADVPKPIKNIPKDMNKHITHNCYLSENFVSGYNASNADWRLFHAQMKEEITELQKTVCMLRQNIMDLYNEFAKESLKNRRLEEEKGGE